MATAHSLLFNPALQGWEMVSIKPLPVKPVSVWILSSLFLLEGNILYVAFILYANSSWLRFKQSKC